MPTTFHRAPLADVPAPTLYGLLALRVRVFVGEQRSLYVDLDGRDAEPGAELLWGQDEDGEVVSTLRLLHEPDGALRIGRVVTARGARGRGLAAHLVELALERCAELAPDAPVVLDAQTHLADWYARFGFAVTGPPFAEDGIPHVPMRRDPPAP